MRATQAPRLLRLAAAVIAALIAAWFRYVEPRHASPERTAYDGLGALHWLGCGLLPMTTGADDDAILQPFTSWADEPRARPPRLPACATRSTRASSLTGAALWDLIAHPPPRDRERAKAASAACAALDCDARSDELKFLATDTLVTSPDDELCAGTANK